MPGSGCVQQILVRVSSRNFILGGGGGKLTDHVAVRLWRGEGRLHNYNYWGRGGTLGQFGGGGEVELFGEGSFPCAPLLR